MIAPCAKAAGVGETIPATEGVAPATFEDLGLPPDSFWKGDVDDEDYDYGSFRSGDFEFPNFYDSLYGSWAWYAYSSIKANDGTSFMDQFQSAPGGGHKSDTFGVAFVDAYWGPSQVWVYGPEEGSVLKGMWVANSAWTRYCVLNGDGMSGPFEKGDYLKVIVTGYDTESEVSGVAEFYLADYRSENEADHYALDTWEWMDLEPLGKIQYFEISMETTKKNAYGPTTPMYTCIDDINTSKDFTSGIENVADGDSLTVNVIKGGLNIFSREGRNIRVVDMNGRIVAITDGVGSVINIPAGIYIVTDGRNVRKIAVR